MPHRARPAALLTALLILALPVSARAVTITEFDVEPGAAAGVHRPYRIHAWSDGNLYYSDQGSSPGIGRMSSAGERLAPIFTGSPAPAEFVPGTGSALVFTSNSGLFVANTGLVFPLEGPGPSVALAYDAAGQLVFSNSTSSLCVRQGQCRTVDGTGFINDLELGPDGALWGTKPLADAVFRVTPGVTGIADDGLTVALPLGSFPTWIASGPDGNLWVTRLVASAVDRITPAGLRTPFALPAGTPPAGIVVGPDGALWIAGSGASTIVRMTTAGAVTNVFPTPTPDAAPAGITVGPDGAIWFAEHGSGKIGRLVLDPPSSIPGGTGQGGGGGSTGPVVRDTLAPRLLATPSFDPASVRAGRSTTLRLTLSEPAELKITIARKTRGRRINGRCLATTPRNLRRATCIRYVTAATLRRQGLQGVNRITVSARRLAPGAYRATIVATDPAGNDARPVPVTFTVLARR